MNCLFCLKADRREELQEKGEADRLYHHVKSEVENGLAYLQVLCWLPHASVTHIFFSLLLHCKFFLWFMCFWSWKNLLENFILPSLKRYQHFSYVGFGCTLFCLHIKTIILQLCLHERYTFVPKFWHQLLFDLTNYDAPGEAQGGSIQRVCSSSTIWVNFRDEK